MNAGTWITQLKKGLSEYIVLLILSKRDSYGYEILQTLQKVDHLGFGESTVYPLLGRLAREGHLAVNVVKSENGPCRRYYRLTSTGSTRLGEMHVYWSELVGSIERIKEKQEHE